MAEILNEMNITSVAFNRLWTNLNTRILPNKVDVVEGKGLSTNDFTNELLAKLNGIEENANKYVHPTSGVSAGTYRSVTVDEKGHITAGTNPDTLAGYGVTEVPADLLTGTISIDRLPHAALERCVVVANDEARFALTQENAQIGDTVKVHVKVKEGKNERIQIFEGTIIYKKHGGISETFTVRKLSYGVGVERTFPVNSPKIAKIEITRKGKVRRSKLYYIRERVGKAAKVKELIK